jgi:hypothetical protein
VPVFEISCTRPPAADPDSAEYIPELTRNSAIDSVLMISRAALSCRGSLTPVASTPSKVQLLSSRARPKNRVLRWVPSPVLIAPGASSMSPAQWRPASGSSFN